MTQDQMKLAVFRLGPASGPEDVRAEQVRDLTLSARAAIVPELAEALERAYYELEDSSADYQEMLEARDDSIAFYEEELKELQFELKQVVNELDAIDEREPT